MKTTPWSCSRLVLCNTMAHPHLSKGVRPMAKISIGGLKETEAIFVTCVTYGGHSPASCLKEDGHKQAECGGD